MPLRLSSVFISFFKWAILSIHWDLRPSSLVAILFLSELINGKLKIIESKVFPPSTSFSSQIDMYEISGKNQLYKNVMSFCCTCRNNQKTEVWLALKTEFLPVGLELKHIANEKTEVKSIILIHLRWNKQALWGWIKAFISNLVFFYQYKTWKETQ